MVATIIISIILIAIVSLIIFKMIKQKRKDCSSCSESCPYRK
ncbi:MAG: FeoB-associated Cys-rich membrane protein [Treponema sp.]|nr:FeoB-associated Cys-rich membrane protein [Treponema sp.]